MPDDFFGTVSLLELIWTTPMAFGTFRYLMRTLGARRYRQRQRLNPSIHPAERVNATARYIRQFILTDILFAWLGAGIIAMTLPQGAGGDPDEPGAWAITGLVLLAAFLLIAKGEIMDHYERHIAQLTRAYINTVEGLYGE